MEIKLLRKSANGERSSYHGLPECLNCGAWFTKSGRFDHPWIWPRNELQSFSHDIWLKSWQEGIKQMFLLAKEWNKWDKNVCICLSYFVSTESQFSHLQTQVSTATDEGFSLEMSEMGFLPTHYNLLWCCFEAEVWPPCWCSVDDVLWCIHLIGLLCWIHTVLHNHLVQFQWP